MRHRIHGKQLNRKSEHRRAMFRNLASGLFEHGQIETTMPKAKAVRSSSCAAARAGSAVGPTEGGITRGRGEAAAGGA